MKPPITLVESILVGQMVGMIFIRKSIPFSAKFFVSITFNNSTTEFWISYESIMDALGRTSSCISASTGWPKSIPCLQAFYHIDVREFVLS